MALLSRTVAIGILAGLVTTACSEQPVEREGRTADTAEVANQADGLAMLPRPSGPHSISTRRFRWTDPSREEGATETGGDFRELYVQLYYPSDSSGGGVGRPDYFRDLQAYADVYPAEVLETLKRTGVHAGSGQPVAALPESFPVILFVHGWQAQSDAYSALMEDIASQGYVVAAIDQPFQGRIVLADGSISQPSEDHFADPMNMVMFYGADQAFVLTKLEELNSVDGDFTGRINAGRVIAMGHSNGAVSALSAALQDTRFQAAISIDNWDPVFEQVFQLSVPLLVLRTGGETAPQDAYLAGSAGAVDIFVSATEHLSASDWPLHNATSDGDRKTAEVNLRIIGRIILAFAEAHLGSDGGVAFDALADDPRITIRKDHG